MTTKLLDEKALTEADRKVLRELCHANPERLEERMEGSRNPTSGHGTHSFRNCSISMGRDG